MNTVRKCDWSEVKTGEVFLIHKQTDGFKKLGAWLTEEMPLTIEGGYVKDFAGRNWIVKAPTATSPKQEVEVVDKASLGIFARITGMNRPNEATGSDPEIFVVKGMKGTLLPAYKFLPTQKEAKAKTTGGYVISYGYRDGFAGECYVYPQGCHSYVIDSVRAGILAIRKAAKAFDPTARLTIKNTFTIPALTMAAAKDEDIAFGCKPSINVYGDKPVVPDDPRKFKLRFAGGHIHLGCHALDKNKAEAMVKAMDIMAAIPAVAMFENLDTPVRRQYYGRAGEYRMPKHGLEYRVLSNAWLCAPSIAHLIWNLTRVGGKIGYSGHLKELGFDEDKVREIINFCDVKAARKWCEDNKQLFVNLLIGDGAHTNEKAWLKVTQEGVESLYNDINDLDTNWHFDDGKWATHSEGPKCDWGKMCRSLVK